MTDAAARERLRAWVDDRKFWYSKPSELTNDVRAVLDTLADEQERTRQLEKTLALARSQFAWIAREATGDNDQGRIIHAAQRGQDVIDALDSAEADG